VDAADRKTNVIKDLLYSEGVRSNEHVHLDAYPSADRKTVMISVNRNFYDCEGCRSKTLGAKIMEGLKRGIQPTCPDCRIYSESMEFEQRALLGRVTALLRREFTVSDEYTGSVMATADVLV
jgi:hypothetical protein